MKEPVNDPPSDKRAWPKPRLRVTGWHPAPYTVEYQFHPQKIATMDFYRWSDALAFANKTALDQKTGKP